MDYTFAMHHFIRIAFGLALIATLPQSGLAQSPAPTDSAPRTKEIIVATREAPPFSFKGPKGKWTGIAIEAWEQIARNLGYTYHYREYGLAEALDAIRDGRADIGVGAYSITAARAEQMYFTHSYASAGLGIATTPASGHLWGPFFDRLLTWNFFRATAILVATLLLVGCLIWFFERKSNQHQFSTRPVSGLSSGFWWSAVTMTTVGYGDKSPVTLGGRLVALLWMFSSIIIISGLTGSIAAALTLVQITPKVSGPQDLNGVAVGTVKESAADGYLRANGIHPTYFEDTQKGLAAVEAESISAFVSDHSILSYWVAEKFSGRVDVLPQSFSPTYLALPMPWDSKNRREVDIALLEFIETPAWIAILTKYNVLR